MAEKTDSENGRISKFPRHVTLTLDWPICIPLFIVHQPLPTHQISDIEAGFINAARFVAAQTKVKLNIGMQ